MPYCILSHQKNEEIRILVAMVHRNLTPKFPRWGDVSGVGDARGDKRLP